MHSTNSSRVNGNIRPLGVPLIVCPERPTLCISNPIDRGDPIWQTRSTSPTSMPNSREAVATHIFVLPAFRACSVWNRLSRDILPWCAAIASSPSRSVS